jgi:hypothetical protein
VRIAERARQQASSPTLTKRDQGLHRQRCPIRWIRPQPVTRRI